MYLVFTCPELAEGVSSYMRRGRESDPRIEVLQTPALPLRHRAIQYALNVVQ